MQQQDQTEYPHATPASARHLNTALKGETHKIRSNNSINTLRLKHHPRRHSINQHLLHLNIRKLARNLLRNLVPKHHPITLRITLRHNRNMLLWSFRRSLERKPHNALHAMAREDRDFRRYLPGLVDMAPAAVPGVLAF